MLRQLVRNSARTPVGRAVRTQTRSLHSPFAVLSTDSSPATRVATEQTNPLAAGTSQNLNDVSAQTTASPEQKEPDAAASSEFDSSTSRVYVVSYPDPSLGAPHGVQLGAYPVGEPFAR